MLEKAKTQIILILFGTLLCLFSLGSIIAFTDPYSAGLLTHISFYLSLFLAVTGLFTVLGLGMRQRFVRGSIYLVNLSASFRQALLLGILVVTSLILQSQGLLLWWVELTLVLFLIFIELFMNL